MPIVPAAAHTWFLELTDEEVRELRLALAERVLREDLTEDEKDAAWSVLAEVAYKTKR